MVDTKFDESVEELCEAVWMAQESGDPRREHLPAHHAEGKVDSEVLERAKAGGLIREDGEEIRLTDRGRELARGLIRRHRLTDVLLFFALGMKSHEDRERITCQVEHTLQPELMDGICTLLGHPAHCPDGQPIPPGPCCEAQLQKTESVLKKLSWCSPGQQVQVKYIQPRLPERLQRLISFGIVPGIRLTVEQTRPVFTLRVEQSLLALDREIADDIYVVPLFGEDAPPPGQTCPGRGRGWFRRWRRHR